jgi:hypothetical protein
MHVQTWITDVEGKRNADMKVHPAPALHVGAQLVCAKDPFQDFLDFINNK